MKFIINTDLERGLPASIDFNFEELRTELSEKLTYYKALVVTEDSIKAGKDERAKLNRLKAAVDDRRKEVKKLCLAPYEAFEFKCKTLTSMIDEASSSIDGQVKAFEEAEKADKRSAIESSYIERVGDLAGLLPLEKIFDPKWLNKTVSLAAAIAQMHAVIDKARNDIGIIRAMKLECEDQMLTAYLARLDMSAALMEKSSYEARQEQLAKMKAAEANPIIHTVPGHGELTAVQAEQVASAMDYAFEQSKHAEATKTIVVRFYDTTAAFRAEMRALTDRHNIQYGGVS